MPPLRSVPRSLSPYCSLSQLVSNCWHESSLSVWFRVNTGTTWYIRYRSSSKKRKEGPDVRIIYRIS